jgi:hypothetical protein
MSLQGLPDFADSPIPGVFGPFEGRGQHVAVPDQLVVATLPDGLPDIRLQLYRPSTPGALPAPYGVLDIGLRAMAPLDDALDDLRELRPRASLTPGLLAGGFASLRPAHAIDGTTPDLATPRPLGWNGLGSAHWSIRLSIADAILLRDELRTKVVPAVASATFELEGVAPRVDAVVRFDPGRLFPLLATLGDSDGLTTRPQIVAFFGPAAPGSPDASPSPAGIEIIGTVFDRAVFASAMADWVRARHAVLAPGPRDDLEPTLRLTLPDGPGAGHIEWDLRTPIVTYRPLAASFSPLGPALDAIAAGDEERVIPPVAVVPELFTGEVEIAIRANVPRPRTGLLELGVTIVAPPNPPARPQAAIVSWQATDELDEGIVRLRLAPTEAVRFRSRTTVVLDDPVDAGPFEGSWTDHDGLRVDLTVDDFGVRFVTIGAEPALLDLARIRARIAWTVGAVARERVADLDEAHPELAVAIPLTADAPTIDVDAEPTTAGRSVHLGPLPLGRLQLGLHSFPDYGPQAVEIKGRFPAAATPDAIVVLDLLPESTPDEADATTVALTALNPTRTWRYLARSPFESGYRFRQRSAGAAGSWSPPLQPREPLIVDGEVGAPGIVMGGHGEGPS